MRQFFYRYRYHFLLWAIYIIYETVLVKLLFNYYEAPLTYILHYFVIIFGFYLYADLALPWALNKGYNPWLRVILVFTLNVFAFIYIHYKISELLIHLKVISFEGSFTLSKAVFFKNLYRVLYFTLFATGYYYLKNYLSERKKSAELEKQRLEVLLLQEKLQKELVQAQNAFLSAQINPHFLFNTLNFIYQKVNAHSPEAGETIIRLSNIMRYALDAGQQGEGLRLKEELQQLEELIRIQELRQERPLPFNLSYPPEVEDLKLIPLVLLTLTENILKHADLQQPINFVLRLEQEFFQLHTSNHYLALAVADSHRQGLQNLGRRLEVAYGNEASMYYTKTGEVFELEIRIPLQLMKD